MIKIIFKMKPRWNLWDYFEKLPIRVLVSCVMHLNKNQGTWSVISVWILMLYCLLNFVMHLTKIGVPDPSPVLRVNRCEHRSQLGSREHHWPSLVWPDAPAVAGTFGSLNLVVSSHKQLCQPPAVNRLPCDLGMLWPPATTNCGHLEWQNSVRP